MPFINGDWHVLAERRTNSVMLEIINGTNERREGVFLVGLATICYLWVLSYCNKLSKKVELYLTLER